MPLDWCKYMQNDVRKRQMVATGGACGLSVAFGAPIGGALFAYEISSPNTFWTFSMLWRVFVSTSTATFTLSILTSLLEHEPLSISDSGAVKFGTLSSENSMLDIPAGIILGVASGLLGAAFIWVNVNVNVVRARVSNTPVKKILECMLFAFVTATCFYLVVALRASNCKPVGEEVSAEELFEFTCPEGEYSPLATLIFNTEGGTIRQFFRYPELIGGLDDKTTSNTVVWTVIIYMLLWYFFMITTYGVAVPAGIFLPGMLVGCSLGLLYLEFLLNGLNVSIIRAGGQSYLVIASAAMLGSYTRLTYSLAVVMMETT
jgi:chloride channel 7